MSLMKLKELVRKNRSCRRFKEHERIPPRLLRELVDLARFAPSAGNLQPLKYVLSVGPETNQRIFECLGWAAYLEDWPGPSPGQRPAGYIIILGDKSVSDRIDCDHGLAAQTILLGAVERGLAGCVIGSIKREPLAEILSIPDDFRILLALALGAPDETRKTVVLGEDRDIRYRRDSKGAHLVPKRGLSEIILAEYGPSD